MIYGAHMVLYSRDPSADGLFLDKVLGLSSVDAGGGFQIFGLPPTEAGFQAAGDSTGAKYDGHTMMPVALFFMCRDLAATMDNLKGHGVTFTDVHTEMWGIRTTFFLPSGAEVGLYEPKHASPLD
jgi:hypothetical protein